MRLKTLPFFSAVAVFALATGIGGAQLRNIGNPTDQRGGSSACSGAFEEMLRHPQLARVTGPSTVYFYSDYSGCPDVGEPCRLPNRHVRAGATVLVSRQEGDWTCAWYEDALHGQYSGELKSSRLKMLANSPNPKPPASYWIGTWRQFPLDDGQENDKLVISAGPGSGLHVQGNGYWYGKPGVQHTGGITADATPTGNHLTATQEDCKVDMALAGNYLITDDNEKCGGVNVRFRGVWRKEVPPSPAASPRASLGK